MDPTTLHTAARRYLIARHAELVGAYSLLPNQGRAADGYHYTPEALGVFPRYNVVDAMRVAIERLNPDALPALPRLEAALIDAADHAQSMFTEAHGEIDGAAITDERARFRTAVSTWLEDPSLKSESLPYRRVLSEEESSSWRSLLEARWSVEDLTWYPLIAGSVPAGVLVLDEGAMWTDDGVATVRQVLAGLNRSRVIELREYGAEYLLAIDVFAATYSGAEGMWTDEHQDWIAYASHEGTVAFGGLLSSGLRESWPEVERWRWSGWQ